MVYYSLCPFDEGAAEIVAALYNIHRDTKKRSKPFTRADILPGLKAEHDDDEPDAGASLFKQLRTHSRNG